TKFILKLFGTGIMLPDLKSYVKTNNIENIYFEGTIEPQNIYEAYKQVDIIINPRIKSKLTDTVTPLKPLEAMAYEKLVIGSNVKGIQELINHNQNGLLFKADNFDSLHNLLLDVRENYPRGFYSEIICTASKFVNTKKSWRTNALKYKKIY